MKTYEIKRRFKDLEIRIKDLENANRKTKDNSLQKVWTQNRGIKIQACHQRIIRKKK